MSVTKSYICNMNVNSSLGATAEGTGILDVTRRRTVINAQCGSLQKVQGHGAGVNADLTPSTGGPVGYACR